MPPVGSGPGSFVIPADTFEPAYLRPHGTGELRERAREALAGLSHCEACPRRCGADRVSGARGHCGAARRAIVASASRHLGEEDCLRGSNGSGTIFFAGCNLQCVFCQNADISHIEPPGPADLLWPLVGARALSDPGCRSRERAVPARSFSGDTSRISPAVQSRPSVFSRFGDEVEPEVLAQIMLELQAAGCHNINLVTPSHVVPQILEALPVAVEAGLRLPLVYNTSAYDSVRTLRLLDGVVDIYMPDFKIWEAAAAGRYLTAEDYPETARSAIREMHSQVGELKLDERGLARRGVLVRHLVLPGGIAGTRRIMEFLAREVSPHTYVNVMAQYGPACLVTAARFREINRRTSAAEHAEALSAAREAGLHRLDSRHSPPRRS